MALFCSNDKTSNGDAANSTGKHNVCHDDVKQYYGKTLRTIEDMGSDVSSCDINKMPNYVRGAIIQIHEEVKER